jgi:hypothetical protein
MKNFGTGWARWLRPQFRKEALLDVQKEIKKCLDHVLAISNIQLLIICMIQSLHATTNC